MESRKILIFTSDLAQILSSHSYIVGSIVGLFWAAAVRVYDFSFFFFFRKQFDFEMRIYTKLNKYKTRNFYVDFIITFSNK